MIFAGRTAQHEICLMLMRPANAEEPKMAIKRFADSMAEYAELISTSDVKAVIQVQNDGDSNWRNYVFSRNLNNHFPYFLVNRYALIYQGTSAHGI